MTTAGDIADLADALAEILREYIVRCGDDTARRRLSFRLAGEGLAAENLRELCECVEERGKPRAQTAAIIATILKTKEAWSAFVADLVFARAAKEKRDAKKDAGTDPYPNMPGGLAPPPTACAHGVPAYETCPECPPVT